jgi:DMSO/TMAO reductase YedYZ molybdopterin-dependent catalytic subunit
MPDWKKLIEAKIALAKRGAKSLKSTALPIDGTSVRDRMPPGQTQVKNFPVLDMGIKPEVPLEKWTLTVFGLVENELQLDWDAFQALPQIDSISDFHCVTRWSQLEMDWLGVSMQEILSSAVPTEAAQYVTLHGYDGYTTNLPLDALLDDDVLIAHTALGEPLTLEHGGPARVIVPKRYAWKGAKWIKAIELHAYDRPGFWEVRGYHNDAFPFEEQRFTDDDY